MKMLVNKATENKIFHKWCIFKSGKMFNRSYRAFLKQFSPRLFLDFVSYCMYYVHHKEF